MSILNSGDSRGIAQAAIVVGQIDHKPAADRLIELLNHEAPDVSIAAAWALRRLAVSSTAEPILRHLVAQTENSLVEIPFSANRDLTWIWDMYEQHKHLIEVLGILRYGPADSLFRTYLPVPLGKPLNHPFHWIHCTHRVELRARAIWALGRLQRDRPSEDLVRPLTALLEDDEEPLYVSATAALSLGKIQITSAVPTLKKYYGPDMRYTEDFPRPSVLAQACRLALESITGESLPALGVVPFEKNETGWFLEPLSSADTR